MLCNGHIIIIMSIAINIVVLITIIIIIIILDPLGHHAVTCKGGGDAVIRHNALRDVFAQFCHRARLGGQLEIGYGSGGDFSNCRPADFLVPNWIDTGQASCV